MRDESKSTAPLAIAAILILMVPPVAYIAGYFAMGELVGLNIRQPQRDGSYRMWIAQSRNFPYDWQSALYEPLVEAESGWLGKREIHKNDPFWKEMEEWFQELDELLAENEDSKPTHP